MKTIVAGSRSIDNYEFVEKIINGCPWKDQITEVVSGTANGIDKLGERWAKQNGLPIKQFRADWNKFGKSAGFKRNEEMANYSSAAIIIHKDESKGAQHMKDVADQHGLKVYYVPVRPKTTFSLEQLKELEVQLEGKGMVGGDLARRLIKQQIAQLNEYQQVANDAKLLWNALAGVEHYIDWDHLYPQDEMMREEIKRAFATPTAKFIQELVKEQNEISNTNRS